MSQHVIWSASAETFQRLVDAAPDAMLVVDDQGVLVYVNAQTEHMFQYTRAEMLGQSIELLIPDRFRGAHVAKRGSYQSQPRLRPMGSGIELFGRKKDGTEIPVEVGLSPLVLPEGRFVCAGVRDVTERYQSRLVVNRLAAIVDSSQDAIIGKTLEGVITSWNPGAARIFGYSAEEAVGASVMMLIPPEREDEEASIRERLRRGEPIAHFETVRRCKDGHLIDVSVSISVVHDARGQNVGAAMVARDVTERMRMEAEARRISQHLANAVESFQGSLALFDGEGRLILCNSTFRLLFGRAQAGSVVGRSFAELIESNIAAGVFDLEGSTPEEVRAHWMAYHGSPEGFLESKLADGRTIRCVGRRTSDGGVVCTAWDITEDVRQKAELWSARAMAESASAAKSDFLASMSHELRTPLNAILGFAQLLQRDRKSPLTERQLERLGHVLKGGEHLLRLIDDVLDLARIETGRLSISVEPVGIASVLEEVKTTLDPLATRAGIELRIVAPAGLPEVLADRIRFRQVLINYGSNAIKYGRKGGTATFVASEHDGRARISVSDDGGGIPLDKQDKIFQPFYRAGQETGMIEGTGIGLAITKRLAEVMGGSVGFTSTPGVGSEFWIELQACADRRREQMAPRSAVKDSSPLAEPGGNRYLIVYVEDNPPNIAFMEDFLADFERITLITASTAEIGIELARARQPDLIIMDINLPGMSGFEAIEHLRQWPETRDIPVVGLSAAAMIRDRKRVEDAGFYRYLTKPVNVDELTGVLEELLARKPEAS